MAGLDRKSYDFYYENGISLIIQEYKSIYEGIIVNPNAKDLIWNTYCKFNLHCKNSYMSPGTHLLDRHKVVACYIYAIEKTHVIASLNSLKAGDSTHLLLNENLAVTFGFSLLRSMILDTIDSLDESLEQKDALRDIFEGDVSLPQCTHGDFKNNLMSQLYFTHLEGNYNILSLAETLYLIECFNLEKHRFSTNILKSPEFLN